MAALTMSDGEARARKAWLSDPHRPAWDTPETRTGRQQHPNLVAKLAYEETYSLYFNNGFSHSDSHTAAYAAALLAARGSK